MKVYNDSISNNLKESKTLSHNILLAKCPSFYIADFAMVELQQKEILEIPILFCLGEIIFLDVSHTSYVSFADVYLTYKMLISDIQMSKYNLHLCMYL